MIQRLCEQVFSVVPENQLERTETGQIEAKQELQRAKQHLVSAVQIRDSDPIGSFQLTYDAARKGLQALLFTRGLRITSRGGHYAYVRFAECGVFESESFNRFRDMRIARNLVEYPTAGISEFDVEFLQNAIAWTHSIWKEAEVLLKKDEPHSAID